MRGGEQKEGAWVYLWSCCNVSESQNCYCVGSTLIIFGFVSKFGFQAHNRSRLFFFFSLRPSLIQGQHRSTGQSTDCVRTICTTWFSLDPPRTHKWNNNEASAAEGCLSDHKFPVASIVFTFILSPQSLNLRVYIFWQLSRIWDRHNVSNDCFSGLILVLHANKLTTTGTKVEVAVTRWTHDACTYCRHACAKMFMSMRSCSRLTFLTGTVTAV